MHPPPIEHMFDCYYHPPHQVQQFITVFKANSPSLLWYSPRKKFPFFGIINVQKSYNKVSSIFGCVIQLAEIADLKSVKCGFDSHRNYHAWVGKLAKPVVLETIVCEFESHLAYHSPKHERKLLCLLYSQPNGQALGC